MGDYTWRLAHALSALGVEASVLTSSQGMKAGHADGESQRERADYPVDAAISRWDFRIFWEVPQSLGRLQPTILHIQYQTAAYGMHPAIALLPRWLRWRHPGFRVVTTLHDLRESYLFPGAGPLRRWLTRQLVLGSHGVITTNAGDATSVARLVGDRPGPRTKVVPIGPNILPPPGAPDNYKETREAWGIPESAYLLGHFGLLNQSKGLETLFLSLRTLLDGDLTVFLLMIGETVGTSDPTNREYEARLRKLAHELALDGNIVWTRYLPPLEVSRALLALDCCVLPYADGASYRRGGLLAALAHGLPVVTTTPQRPSDDSLSGQPALKDGEHCRLVPSGDANQLATLIHGILTDPSLRANLSAGARRIAASFSWDSIARRTTDFYHDLLDSSGPRRS